MDDNNSSLEEHRIDMQRQAMGGGLNQRIGGNGRDPRFTSLIGWAWLALGGVAIAVGWGVYDKLSSINDTLISAVADIKNQGTQVAELKSEVRELRASQTSLQRQVDGLDGRMQRGIEEITRGN